MSLRLRFAGHHPHNHAEWREVCPPQLASATTTCGEADGPCLCLSWLEIFVDPSWAIKSRDHRGKLPSPTGCIGWVVSPSFPSVPRKGRSGTEITRVRIVVKCGWTGSQGLPTLISKLTQEVLKYNLPQRGSRSLGNTLLAIVSSISRRLVLNGTRVSYASVSERKQILIRRERSLRSLTQRPRVQDLSMSISLYLNKACSVPVCPRWILHEIPVRLPVGP